MYKHAQRSLEGSAQRSVVIWMTPRGWICCKLQQFIRHPAATFISLLYLLHKPSSCYGRIRSRSWTHTRRECDTHSRVSSHVYSVRRPFGVRDENRHGFVINVTYAARGTNLCFIPRKLYIIINFIKSISNG